MQGWDFKAVGNIEIGLRVTIKEKMSGYAFRIDAVEPSVTNNSLSQDYSTVHDQQATPTDILKFKPLKFSIFLFCRIVQTYQHDFCHRIKLYQFFLYRAFWTTTPPCHILSVCLEAEWSYTHIVFLCLWLKLQFFPYYRIHWVGRRTRIPVLLVGYRGKAI